MGENKHAFGEWENRKTSVFSGRETAQNEITWIITLGERSSGVIVVQKQHKIRFGYPDEKAGEINPIAENIESVWNL